MEEKNWLNDESSPNSVSVCEYHQRLLDRLGLLCRISWITETVSAVLEEEEGAGWGGRNIPWHNHSTRCLTVGRSAQFPPMWKLVTGAAVNQAQPAPATLSLAKTDWFSWFLNLTIFQTQSCFGDKIPQHHDLRIRIWNISPRLQSYLL